MATITTNKYSEVYTNDDTYLAVLTEWDTTETYYILQKKYFAEDDIRTSIDHAQAVRFVEYDGITLNFMTETGIKISIDPTNENTRENVVIFWDCSGVPLPETWFEIKRIPFDRNFFKLGHPYMIRTGTGRKPGDPVPALLIGMTFDQLHFIKVAHPERVKDPGIDHVYIDYRKYDHYNKDFWFSAMIPGDEWTNHKEEKNGDS